MRVRPWAAEHVHLEKSPMTLEFRAMYGLSKLRDEDQSYLVALWETKLVSTALNFEQGPTCLVRPQRHPYEVQKQT